ncbi:DUF2306 domain-containing protein [Sandarakinorhabdus sp. DWP1-3-1]|uniref:DUF2306 domain-containing protein n=1 Tax=Sandarakinorhabdus sp. DWP1-3-1 TaxID=2804627 RepID=UPI003CF80BD8
MFANLTPMLWLHFVAAALALSIGVAQLVLPKGGTRHRQIGWAYAAAMLAVNIGALTTYRLGFGIFHVLAFVSLYSLAMGLWAMRRWRQTGAASWLRRHRIDMGFSYLGLVMAGVSQFAINPRFGLAAAMPPLLYWGLFAAINIVMYAIGNWLIFRNAGAVPAPTR